jgi:GDP-L-fucose synthase
MRKDSKIYIAGHNGMVGSSILRLLQTDGYSNLVVRSSKELDLRDHQQVNLFFERERPEYVFLAAAKVGGSYANRSFPVEFMLDNLRIQTNVFEAAHKFAVKRLLFISSASVYPEGFKTPISEDKLMTGRLNSNNSAYAISKISGMELCASYFKEYNSEFISIVPCNIFGPKDNFDELNSHVMASLIRKTHDAKQSGSSFISIWGDGQSFREFIFVDDFAKAALLIMIKYTNSQHINVGTGYEIKIDDLVKLIMEVLDVELTIRYDTSKPNGTRRMTLNSDKLRELGWSATIGLREGIQKTYDWYVQYLLTKSNKL